MLLLNGLSLPSPETNSLRINSLYSGAKLKIKSGSFLFCEYFPHKNSSVRRHTLEDRCNLLVLSSLSDRSYNDPTQLDIDSLAFLINFNSSTPC